MAMSLAEAAAATGICQPNAVPWMGNRYKNHKGAVYERAIVAFNRVRAEGGDAAREARWFGQFPGASRVR